MESPNELAEAFATAIPFALREMAGVEVLARGTGVASPTAPSAEMTASIRLTTAAGEWRLVLVFPDETATNLARRILMGTGVEPPPEMVRDCMGEVANVVAGQAKSLLVGSPFHFTLSTPTVSGGAGEEGAGGRVIRFDSDAGDFAARLVPRVT